MGHSLITGMVSGVAQPVLTEVANDAGRQRNVFRKMLRFTAFISFPAMFGLALIAHELIVISVTDKWLDSVPILQLLCIWGAFLPILSLYSNLIISKGKSDIYMWNTIALGDSSDYSHFTGLSLRYTYHDRCLCDCQYCLDAGMALFCMATNPPQSLECTERRYPLCRPGRNHNGCHLLCNAQYRQHISAVHR